MENYLGLMSEALPPLERVQVLASTTELGKNAFIETFRREAFAPFTRGQVSTEALRVRGVGRLRGLPVVAQSYVNRLPRGGGWVGRRSFKPFAAGVGPAIAASADRPDILHVFAGGNLAAAGVIAARSLGVPLVVTPQAHPGQWDDDPLSGRAYRAATRVVASGEPDADTYRALGVTEEQLRISAPCTAHSPRGGGPRVRAEYRVEGPVVLYVGRRSAYKGVDLLVDAVARLGDVTLVLLGAGDPITVSTGTARVIDLGAVSDEDKAAWLEAADVLCLPSANESFGLVVAEGWSFGVPAVTSDIPPLRSLVEEVGGGLAVERSSQALADALAKVLGDPEGARRMGEYGLSYWRSHLSPEAAARRMMGVYEELMVTRADRTGAHAEVAV